MKIKTDARGGGSKLYPFWNMCVGAGRANEGLRSGWMEQLKIVAHECGFKYCRFHGLFHDDMFVCRTLNGKSVFNWQYVDDLFDRMLDIGVRPFVELGFCPRELASVCDITFWWKGHGSPPKDYAKWADLVANFTRHCIQRYGIEEVREWYFEVWNEPNLDFFFAGTKTQYFELYKTTAETLKSIDAGIRVGGPSTSNFVPDARFDGELEDKSKGVTNKVEDLTTLEWKGVWIEDFIRFCEKNNLPLDFISTHPYPTDYALDNKGEIKGRSREVDSTKKDLGWIRRIVDQSCFRKTEIHLTEWNSSPSHRDHMHDHLPAAAFIVKCNLESIGLVDSLSYWTFTDIFEEDGGGPSVFHGGFGLINFQGIVKPAFHAYRFLNMLGDEILSRDVGAIVTRNSRNGMISALLFNYPTEMPLAVPMSMHDSAIAEQVQATGAHQKFDFTLENINPGSSFDVETLDIEHGCVLETWKKMGCPEPPTREQTSMLKKAALATKHELIVADSSGTLNVTGQIAPWSLIMIREVK